MTEMMWIRSHVELLLGREWGTAEVLTDPDGDYPFRRGTAMCWVSVAEYDIVMVRVFAHAAFGLKPSAKLFRELNDIENRCVSARVSLVGDVAMVSQTISPIGLTQPVLTQALEAVANVAADVGCLLAAAFDGHTPFEVEVNDSEDAF